MNKKSFALLRIAFGFIWLIDAWFKWQPAFLNNFASYLMEGAQGQPMLIQSWVDSWMQFIAIDPFVFAVIIALAETAIAIGLIFGLFTRVAIIGGTLLAFTIWATAEGFGGPYGAGSTDMGAGIIYVFVFVALWIGQSWRHLSVDSRISRRG